MFGSKYLRAQAARLIAVSNSTNDVKAKAALIEVADDLLRWADELDDDDPPKSNGSN